jgi:hypothetical protein
MKTPTGPSDRAEMIAIGVPTGVLLLALGGA